MVETSQRGSQNAKEDKAERISLESHMFLDHVSVQVEREPGPVLFLFSVFCFFFFFLFFSSPLLTLQGINVHLISC